MPNNPKEKEKKPRGRPKKEMPSTVQMAENMGTIGMTMDRIARIFGMDEDTVRANTDIYSAILNGRAKGDGRLLKTAFEMATNDKNTSMVIFLLKTRLGMSEKSEMQLSGPGGTNLGVNLTPQAVNAIEQWARAAGRSENNIPTI